MVRIRSKVQQVQNFSGVCWPAGRRAAVSSQTDWYTSPLSVTTYFHPSSTGFSKDGSNAPQISGSRCESTCPLRTSPSVFAVCPLPPEPENGGYICHPPALQRPLDGRQCHRVPVCRRLHAEGRLQIPDLQGWRVEAGHGGQLPSQ